MYKDIFGTPIRRGDYVALGRRNGVYGELTIAIILEEDVSKSHYNGGQRIRVFTHGSSRSGDSYADQMLVLDFTNIPKEYKQELAKAYSDYWAKKLARKTC